MLNEVLWPGEMADHPACVGGQQHKCLRMVGSQASVCLAEVSTLGGGGGPLENVQL